MSRVHRIRNGVVLTGGPEPKVIREGSVAWRDDRIVAVGKDGVLGEQYGDAHVLDAGGGLVLPGLVNLHHHFYSALARGLDVGGRPRGFAEVLDLLWWRLDRSLDLEAVRLSAMLSVADCIRWGCTTVFDHHASPSCIAGSLGAIAEAVEAAGLSAVLCYEVTDRNGPEGAAAGIEENLAFLESRRSDPRVRGVMGLHASFTLREETLAAVADRRPPGGGCHVHVAEDPVDVSFSREAFGAGPVERLGRYGLLDERALLAHGIHLEEADYESVAEAGATVVHNPESNAHNAVGRLDLTRVGQSGCAVGLGTDGMSSSVLRALRFALLALRSGEEDPGAGFDRLLPLLETNVRVARRFLDEPLLGTLAEGAPADLISIDAPPPTPLDEANLAGHLVYGAAEAPVRHTVARGRILLDGYRHVTLDPGEIARAAREVAPRVWRRFRDQEAGTPFLGPGTAAPGVAAT